MSDEVAAGWVPSDETRAALYGAMAGRDPGVAGEVAGPSGAGR